MSYFKNFPQIYYSFSTGLTITSFVMTDILRRVKADANNILTSTAYDEYDIKDGETPEIIADQIYNNPDYHWVVLVANEIIDPRYDWPLTVLQLQRYLTEKYGAGNENAAHHYENSNGDTVYYKVYTGTVAGTTTSAGSSIGITGTGTAFLSELRTGNTIRFGTTTTAYTITALNNNTNIAVSGNAITGTFSGRIFVDNNSYSSNIYTVTNAAYEDAMNEHKRRIKLIKPEFLPQFVRNFVGILNNGD